MNFINLTNGIKAIEDYKLTDYRFIRIQSTWCEQKRWNDILMCLSDDFLMQIALGNICIVYDYGANKQVPRAIWQGLEWIKFVLYKRWYNDNYIPLGRAKSGKQYFEDQYRLLDKCVTAKIDYFKQFVYSDIPKIISRTGSINECNRNRIIQKIYATRNVRNTSKNGCRSVETKI